MKKSTDSNWYVGFIQDAQDKETEMPKTKKPLVEFYNDKKGERRWRARSKSGRVLADSGEGYNRAGACRRGLLVTWKALDDFLHGKP